MKYELKYLVTDRKSIESGSGSFLLRDMLRERKFL